VTLEAVFNSTQPAPSGFGAQDALLPGAKTSQTIGQGGQFTVDGSETGVEVPEGQKRALWLQVQTPTSTSTTAPQQIQVTVTATP
jgi:hypothetical protein